MFEIIKWILIILVVSWEGEGCVWIFVGKDLGFRKGSLGFMRKSLDVFLGFKGVELK